MMSAERELLLLCTFLNDGLQPLTLQQYRSYCVRFRDAGTEPPERLRLLLSRTSALQRKLNEWSIKGISYVTVLDPAYPERLLEKLGEEAPPVLFLLGNRELLGRKGIALVGSRALNDENRVFAEAVGSFAADNGLILISGDARGADRAAQHACIRAGGQVVSFVSDSMLGRTPVPNVLYVSESSPETGFSAIRAHSRNRYIHCMGLAVFVAQTADGTGGSWSGSLKNLRKGWTPLYIFDDGSAGADHLIREGAVSCSALDFSRKKGAAEWLK